jgi:hypothetical protein
MPLGLSKSKWEMYRQEWARLDAEWREQAKERAAEREKHIAEWRASLERDEARWADFQEGRDRELVETQKFRKEVLARMEAHHASMNTVERETALARKEAEDAAKAHTAALFRLIDRFDDFEGRPPERAA